MAIPQHKHKNILWYNNIQTEKEYNMRVELPPHIYTKINTDRNSYLIQNLSSYNVLIVVSDSAPTKDTPHDYSIEYLHAIGNMHVKGICWGMPEGRTSVTVGLTEG